METSCTYRIYCSKCNKDKKKKMSWGKYLYYVTTDRKSKGYHEIDSSFVSKEPTKCPFGHEINTQHTKTIIVKNNNGANDNTNEGVGEEFRTDSE